MMRRWRMIDNGAAILRTFFTADRRSINPQPRRLKKLNEVAIQQMRILCEVSGGRRMFALVKTGLKPDVVLTALQR